MSPLLCRDLKKPHSQTVLADIRSSVATEVESVRQNVDDAFNSSFNVEEIKADISSLFNVSVGRYQIWSNAQGGAVYSMRQSFLSICCV